MARALSLEDKDLSVSPINLNRRRVYSDIDLTFAVKENGDIFKKNEAAAVKQAVKNLVMTNYYEKPFNPTFGCSVRSMLFELADDDTQFEIENNVKAALQRHEPRARILSVVSNVALDNNSIDLTVIFKVINTEEEVTFTTTLIRLR